VNATEYPAEEFGGLYEKRWGIETYFDRLKNLLEVERFSSKKVVGIEQDFCGLVFLSTPASVLLKEEEEEAERRSRARGLEYTCKVNRSVCYLTVVDHVVELLLDRGKSPEEAEEEIRLRLRGALIPVRPGRRTERKPQAAAGQLRLGAIREADLGLSQCHCPRGGEE